mmetsp:Transcript_40553/g.107494  ORF Transcript_40553/g.107494 Transcript_40553/m.107494 type:complete len:89 (+) Transcript_40553:507-773(+)
MFCLSKGGHRHCSNCSDRHAHKSRSSRMKGRTGQGVHVLLACYSEELSRDSFVDMQFSQHHLLCVYLLTKRIVICAAVLSGTTHFLFQ